MATTAKSSLAERLDSMYEFDREPVSEKKLHNVWSFINMYAGEHVAGTEFVIGPLFVVHGVTAIDLFVGLIIGNLLAVMSWAFICAPIAVKTRLTLYWLLRKICGPYLTYAYSLVNAIAFCLLAGSMISVSATAVGLPLNMPMPQLTDFYPTSVSWVLVVLFVGTVVTCLAILGFEKISKFSKSVCPGWRLFLSRPG